MYKLYQNNKINVFHNANIHHKIFLKSYQKASLSYFSIPLLIFGTQKQKGKY